MMKNTSLPPEAELALGTFKSVALRASLEEIPPAAWSYSLDQLESLINPSSVDLKLKLRFWEIANARSRSRKQTLGALCVGICSYTNLYNHVLKKPYKLAWLIKLDFNTEKLLAFLQEESLNKISELVHLPIFDHDGSINYKNAELVLKAYSCLFRAS